MDDWCHGKRRGTAGGRSNLQLRQYPACSFVPSLPRSSAREGAGVGCEGCPRERITADTSALSAAVCCVPVWQRPGNRQLKRRAPPGKDGAKLVGALDAPSKGTRWTSGGQTRRVEHRPALNQRLRYLGFRTMPRCRRKIRGKHFRFILAAVIGGVPYSDGNKPICSGELPEPCSTFSEIEGV